MSVANASIDDQHRYLICLINTIELAMKTDDYRDILKITIDQLVDYTRYHFSHEEKIQQKIQYPAIDDHKREHQKIIAALEDIRQQLDSILQNAPKQPAAQTAEDDEITDEELNQLLADEPQAKSMDEQLDPLLKLFRSWIIDHVLKADLHMRPYLKKYPPNLSA